MLTVVVGKSAKKKGAEELKWEALAPEELSILASTEALFGGAKTYVLMGALAGERMEEFLDIAEVLAESPHTFIFEEEKLLKRETDILTKAGAKIEKKEKAAAGKSGFDPFGITFALGSRDKKKLWLGLTQAIRAGEKPEALAGLLAWKARQMKDAKLSRELVWMYHDSHRGAGDLELLLERFALKL
ncbi:MAG TPA: hypothetical protein VHD55_02300 [Candidatus Paceibacterota bacterium]|nr:hypothetical protein [Candidatus Paceibacterota bacterium]